jgi:hypothetical protein
MHTQTYPHDSYRVIHAFVTTYLRQMNTGYRNTGRHESNIIIH